METRRDNITGFKHFSYNPEEINEYQVEIDNIIYKTDKKGQKWIQETTEKLAEWRSIFKSTYARWAISVNGLFVASEKYSNPYWQAQNQFSISTIRKDKNSKLLNKSIIVWDGTEAAKKHHETVNYICEYGIIDLYACFEEFVFSLYKCFLNYNPQKLIRGDENKEIRKLYKNKGNNDDELKNWELAWEERLTNWQRKRLYDSLHKVLLDYCNSVGLKKHKESNYGPYDWAVNIEFIGMIRNCITHGQKTVPKELIEIAKKSKSLNTV